MFDITAYAITWNEQYMLPYWHEHYSKFCKKLVIIDNESTDDTVKIAKELGIEVRTYKTDNFQDNLKMLEVKNNCWKDATTDWVIVGDVDEMWWKIDNLIKYTPNRKVFKPRGWNMVGDINENQSIFEITRGERQRPFDKCMLFSSDIEEINYSPGCHNCDPKGGRIIRDMQMRHFMFLNEEYVVQRYKRYADRMCESDKENGFGVQYLSEEQRIREGYRNQFKRAKEVH